MADESDTKNKPLQAIYHPAPGDPKTTEIFGQSFVAGEAVDVDPKYRDKLAGNPHFEIKGEKTFGDEQRAKASEADEDDGEPLTFDEAVTANRMEEYGTADAAEADRLRQIGEAAFVRPAPKRKVGRPTKEDLRSRQQEEESRARAEEHSAEMADIQQEKVEDQAETQRRAAEVERMQAEQRALRTAPQPTPAPQPAPQPRPNK
jgi:hypothetical protein